MRLRSIPWFALLALGLLGATPGFSAELFSQQFRPLDDRVVVRPIEEEKMKGGIIIPDTAREKGLEGMVVKVGPGSKAGDGTRVPLDVKPGDRILYGAYAGTEIKLDGESHLIMREDDILAVIE